MEFHIAITDTRPQLEAVEDAMFDVDSNALVDLDPSGSTLRISSFVTIEDLIDVMQRTGWTIAPDQVVQLPTICCGGCGG
ncbi:hypothetical protein ASD22_02385 [Rhodanobacter sp. Root480]|jgi:hypothetical protein|uniref:hypothetical protein n=1 Tax=unclassified Rhodanobacter TaxID=2621553 RepID=UPI0006FA138A|nr:MULTISPECIES: hypothetical protein [unclassified Rhodanobacter]KQX99161.1 hypothetical protein ASD22_02385 [Rhodanobacter sp. Root480]KRA35321.1 hypothetical protein ASD68_02485 [Rhodanobacter sp. Root627]HUH54903.1 hypothetical protein [Rhodanobacter sp.]